ncbi:Kelch motif protein [compost metagenome]
MIVFGGIDAQGASAKVHSYDPATNLWSALLSGPTAAQRSDHVVAVINGEMYVATGSSGTIKGDVYKFKP